MKRLVAVVLAFAVVCLLLLIPAILYGFDDGNSGPGLSDPTTITSYVADFDVKQRKITNLKPFANAEGKKVWFAYPRFTKDESSIVYQAGGKLFLYSLQDGSTVQVSTDNKADYRYPHGEATPN